MQPSRTLRCLALFAFPLMLAAFAKGQITTLEDYHGQPIACSISGLRGAYSFCGSDKTNSYEYIFVGSIVSIASFMDHDFPEFRLRVQREEVFRGNPAGELTIVSSQGACIDNEYPLQVGDRWLFFVFKSEKSPDLLFSYGDRTAPYDKSASELSLLRLQRENPHSGLISGIAQRPERFKDEDGDVTEQDQPVAHHSLIATSKQDGAKVSVPTDEDGHFRFPPLTPGDYHVTANTASGWWAEDINVDVHPGSCAYAEIALAPDGAIRGKVFDANGKPVKEAEVEVAPSGGPLGTGSNFTKADGSYEIRGLGPGRYLVGIGIIESQPPSPYTVYYPGFPDAAYAVLITLGNSEHRDGIDIHLPK